MATNALTQRVAREAILTAGTVVRLTTDASAIFGDQERVPDGEEGFDLSGAIGVDVRIVGALSPSRRRFILQFVRANVVPNASDVTWDWRDQAVNFSFADTYDASVALPGTVDLWLAGVRQAIEDSFGPNNTDGTATIVDWDEDGNDDAIVIDVNEYDGDGVAMEWNCYNIVAPTGTILWYEPASISARLYTRSEGTIPDGYASALQAALAVSWCLAADLGPIGRSWEERCSFPGRSWGWVELYDVTDPSTYTGGITGTTPQAFVVATMLPAQAPA